MKKFLWGILALLLFAVLSSCSQTVVEKKVVDVQYKGTLADGSTFSESQPDHPLEFLVGAHQIIPGLEKAVVGMKAGQKKKIQIKAADAYGAYDDNAVQEIPKTQLPADWSPEKGKSYQMRTSQGPIVVTVKDIKEKTVVLDFNPPLAGKDLTFELTITKIRDATKDELQAAAMSETPGTPQTQSQAPASSGTPDNNPPPVGNSRGGPSGPGPPDGDMAFPSFEQHQGERSPPTWPACSVSSASGGT